jgi:hypothetical protein
MRKKIDYGGSAGPEMVRKFWEKNSEVIVNHQQRRTLSEALVELLNGDTLTTATKDRVVRIIHLLRAHQVILNQSMEALRDDKPANTLIPSLIQFNSELNERLLRYKIIPQVDLFKVAPRLAFIAADSHRQSAEDFAEVQAVWCMLQIAERNQIDDVRECSCHRYFVAGRIDQTHCSVKCRVKAHQSSEEFKAKRRVADRERYRLHRDGKVKETDRRKNGTKKAR